MGVQIGEDRKVIQKRKRDSRFPVPAHFEPHLRQAPCMAPSILPQPLREVISQILQSESSRPFQGMRTLFDLPTPPSMSVAAFLTDVLLPYGLLGDDKQRDDTLIYAAWYIRRLLQLQPDLKLHSLNCHMLLLVAVMSASKMYDDVHYDNRHFGNLGGLDLKTINELELQFLRLLGWSLHVADDTKHLFYGAEILPRMYPSRNEVVPIMQPVVPVVCLPLWGCGATSALQLADLLPRG